MSIVHCQEWVDLRGLADNLIEVQVNLRVAIEEPTQVSVWMDDQPVSVLRDAAKRPAPPNFLQQELKHSTSL